MQRVWQQDLGADSFQDHFQVAEVVNDGTTGTVRRCVDKLSGLSYAVKVRAPPPRALARPSAELS